MTDISTLGTETARGAYVLVELCAPGQAAVPAGVLLLDPQEDRLHARFRSQWPGTLAREDRAVVDGIAGEIQMRADTESGSALLAWLEDTFSHTLRLGERRAVLLARAGAAGAAAQADQIFAREVGAAPSAAGVKSPGTVIPFETHLPYYPLRIAAGVFGGDVEAPDALWVPVPEGLRADARYFVGRISGHSMEPRIPDGSFCLFRARPQGSREGKLLLVQRYGSSDSGGEFTIKRYHAEKAVLPAGVPEEFDDAPEWRHRRVRLISLNPAYPSWDLEADQCEVIAEFVRVLDDAEVPLEIRSAEASSGGDHGDLPSL